MDALALSPGRFCTVAGVLAAGTTTTLSSTNAYYYSIKGKAYTKAALSNAATPTTDAVTGVAFLGVKANNGCVFIVGFNAAGTMKVIQGSIVALDTTGAFIVASQFGPLPDDFCPVGYVVIKAGSTANNTTGWIFGTSNNSSVTGITYAFVDVMTLPDRPQIS